MDVAEECTVNDSVPDQCQDEGLRGDHVHVPHHQDHAESTEDEEAGHEVTKVRGTARLAGQHVILVTALRGHQIW